ncbi:MAG: hypothetical protein F4045_08795 [Chloroflexi bacterium]|nr:hypothetical protein [Chloroflexota bacterium]MYK35181.1 hypothetical protein [Chloroflexota bacterium]
MTQPPGTLPFITTLSVALFGAAIEAPLVVRSLLRVAGHDVIFDHAKAGPEAVLSPVLEDYASLLFQTCVDSNDLSAEEILEAAYAEAARSLEANEEMAQWVGWVIYSLMQRFLTEWRIARENPQSSP